MLLYDTPAGELTRSKGRLGFRYLTAYQDRADATPVSLSMPLSVGEHLHRTVEPFLWGLLPDNDDVLKRWGRRFGVSSSNPFSLLSEVGEDCAGAVQIVREERVEELESGSVQWLTEEQVADRLRDLRADPTDWLSAGPAGQWSLAGAQAKLALHHDDGRWGRPAGRVPTTHILKPAISGLDDHDLNEQLCLDLARRLGLRAARSWVQAFGDERAVCVERYDRFRSTTGWRRVHQEDLCQALAVPPGKKYQADGGPSPERIAALLRTHLPAPRADDAVRAFVDALALSWIIVGSDAHAKNYSLLLSGDQVRLAPLYDVASFLPYDSSDGHRLRLPMNIGGRYDVSWIGVEQWRSLAQDVGLDPDSTLERVRELAIRTPDALADACAADDVRALGSALPARLLEAVAAQARACVRRLSAGAPAVASTRWTVAHVRRLLDELGEPQRRLLLALAEADGELAAGDVLAALGDDRPTLRGLIGPVTKAIQRLQLRELLPADLPQPVRTTYESNLRGYRAVRAMEMPPEIRTVFHQASPR